MYQKPSTANKVHLIRRLFNFIMQEGKEVQQHLNEFNMITSQLNSVDIKFADEIRALILLLSLPESWAGTVTAVTAAETNLTVDRVRDLMIGEEVRRKESGSSTSGSVLSTEQRGRSKRRQIVEDQNPEEGANPRRIWIELNAGIVMSLGTLEISVRHRRNIRIRIRKRRILQTLPCQMTMARRWS